MIERILLNLDQNKIFELLDKSNKAFIETEYINILVKNKVLKKVIKVQAFQSPKPLIL